MNQVIKLSHKINYVLFHNELIFSNLIFLYNKTVVFSVHKIFHLPFEIILSNALRTRLLEQGMQKSLFG